MRAVYFVATALVGVAMFWVELVGSSLGLWERQETTAALGEGNVEMQRTELSAEELAAQGYVSVEELKIRIDDGEVQWFDGVMWHTVAPVEELAKEDKFYVAQEGFQEFEEQMKQQREERRAEMESPEERGETLLVGQKETPKPVDKPKPTKPAATAPAEETVSAPVAPSEGGGNPGGGGNGGGGTPGGGDSGNSGGGNPGGGDSGNSGGGNPSGGDSGNSGGNSGGNGGEVPPGGDGGNTSEGGGAGDSGNDGSGDSGGDTGDGENMEWSDDYL